MVKEEAGEAVRGQSRPRSDIHLSGLDLTLGALGNYGRFPVGRM